MSHFCNVTYIYFTIFPSDVCRKSVTYIYGGRMGAIARVGDVPIKMIRYLLSSTFTDTNVHPYLTTNIFEVVLPKSISTQIRQLTVIVKDKLTNL